jgi:hypothetical protein
MNGLDSESGTVVKLVIGTSTADDVAMMVDSDKK